MGNASEVYTRLGIEAVEKWTALKQRYEDIKFEMEHTRDQGEIDKLLKEIQSVGTLINKIEADAGIETKQRTS
jgi:hypothetical protein